MPKRLFYKAGFTALILAAMVPMAHAERWSNVRKSCSGRTLNVSAQLVDIPWGQSWEAACAKKPGQGVGFGISRRADRCINNAGMWGEWSVRNHPQCAPKYEWGEVKEACTGEGVQTVSAKLFNIPSGESWESACNSMNAAGQVSQKGVSGRPDRCVTVAAGVYGEWDKNGAAACTKTANWEEPKKDGCFGPDQQVYSARLWDIPAGQDWVEACRKMEGPNNWGKPSRCTKDALATGVWGQWYTNESCAVPLEWGVFKDNGCVRDMKEADANTGGISSEGFRSFSAVLYNVGGDWVEACRKATISGRTDSGIAIESPYPTACVLADADDALGWVATAVIGAGTAFITAPTGPVAIAASGAAVGLVSKAVEGGLFDLVDANLNVWGIIWVEDDSCGIVDYGIGERSSNDRMETFANGGDDIEGSQYNALPPVCPTNATNIRGGITCSCAPRQTERGTVWGSDLYTADSSICKAALHQGEISREGGVVSLKILSGQDMYSGSTRNGVTSSSYGRWGKSYRFE